MTNQAPTTLEDFMRQAYALEREAVERYTEFADSMETHNNLEVAAMFRTMAGYESKHAQQIMAEMGWTEPPEPPAGGFGWTGFEAPETVPIDEASPLEAVNPYGRTKLTSEDMMRDLAASDPAWRIILLRYFNPVGAHPSG